MAEHIQNTIVFQAPNKHSVEAGKPPTIDAGIRKRYHGYFENEFQEQFIFVYDYEVREATLWVGDAGWEQSYKVKEGNVPELLLGTNERTWLSTCWQTATSILPK